MALVGLKHGLEMDRVDHRIYHAIAVVSSILDPYGEPVVTSLRDGIHMNASLHYKGLAVDFRAHHMNAESQRIALGEIKAKLGKDYDVILHGEGQGIHFHIEYDPKVKS